MDFTRILLFYGVLLISLVFHEAAHALFAMLGGDRTAYRGGQVTLNPVPHIRRAPFGTVILPLAVLIMSQGRMCFGFAHAPYDPLWAHRHPKRAALMSAAGPLANIFLAAVAFFVMKILIASDLAETFGPGGGAWNRFVEQMEMLEPTGGVGGYVPAVIKMASVFLFLNVLLAFINLLPIPPFDGAGVVEGLFTKTQAFFDMLRGQNFTMIIGLVLAWYLLGRWMLPILGWVYGLL